MDAVVSQHPSVEKSAEKSVLSQVSVSVIADQMAFCNADGTHSGENELCRRKSGYGLSASVSEHMYVACP
jgi:hypothetical protein